MRIKEEQGRRGPAEEPVHTELAGGRFGVVYRSSMPFTKVRLTRQNIILIPGLIRLGGRPLSRNPVTFLRQFRIPLDRISYVQSQKTLLVSEVKIVHSEPDVPAAISILSFNPARLLKLFSSLGIRVDDRARVAASPGRHRVGAYVQAVGGLLLFVVGLLCIAALTVWAVRRIAVSGV